MLRQHSQGAWTCGWEVASALSLSFRASLHGALLAASPVQPRASEASALYLLGNHYVPEGILYPTFHLQLQTCSVSINDSSKIKPINS